MKQFFVTGTDTNVGKTLVSAVLTLVLNAYYWKPIQSGLAEDISEQHKVQQLTGMTDDYFLPSVYSLQAPLAPDQAGRLENIAIDLSHCNIPETTKPLIIEGAGGVFVPLNHSFSMLDLMQQYQLPIIIVARGTLGTINHTLLTIEALRQRNLMVHGVVFSGELNRDNQTTIERWGNIRTLFHLPFLSPITATTLQNWVHQQRKNIIEALYEFSSA